MNPGTQTFYVTYAHPKSGSPTVGLGTTPDPDNPFCYPITVNVTPGMRREELRSIVFAQAEHKFRTYIQTHYARKVPAPPQVPSVFAKSEDDEPELVFDPSEITPFIEEAIPRWGIVAGTAIRLELTGHGTASTDCISVMTVNPDPLLRGLISDFFGRGYHEGGHIRFDRDGTPKDRARRFSDPAVGTALLKRAHDDGGEALGHILNLIIDRRADWLNAIEFPGNALDLWCRLGDLLPGERKGDNGEVIKQRSGVALDCYDSVFTDFVYACKKKTKARHACVRKAVAIADKACKRVNAGTHKYALLLTAAKRVLAILKANATEMDKEREQEREEAEQAFNEFMQALQKHMTGQKVSGKVQKFFRQLMANRLAVKRQHSLSQLSGAFQAATGTGSLPAPPPPNPSQGPFGKDGKLIKVKPDAAAYALVYKAVRPYVGLLRDAIQQLAVPERNVVQGLVEGEFDIEALPMLVTGRPDVMKIELCEIKLDLALSLVVDVSGSMSGSPVKTARGIGVCFNEAVRPVSECVDAWFYAFDHDVYDCGPACPNNGIAKDLGGGGTSEAFALRHAAQPLGRSVRRRKVIVVVCDGGPNDLKACEQEVENLMRAGILPIRILVGVDYAPGTYPVELFFDSWTEFYRELGRTFDAIFRAARY